MSLIYKILNAFVNARVPHLFSFLCLFVFCFVLIVFVLCLLYQMLPVSLACPFGIFNYIMSVSFICGCKHIILSTPPT